jgi:hypothetical protein
MVRDRVMGGIVDSGEMDGRGVRGEWMEGGGGMMSSSDG